MKISNAPIVHPDMYEAVYDHYESWTPNEHAKSLGYRAADMVMRPNVHISDTVTDSIARLRDENTSIVVAANHIAVTDPLVVSAAFYQKPILRPLIKDAIVGAKSTLFRQDTLPHSLYRRAVETMGSVPVFRPQDHPGHDKLQNTTQRLIDLLVGHLRDGKTVALFPEGSCNEEDPATVLPLKGLLGQVVCRAVSEHMEVAILPIGIYYGVAKKRRHAEMVINAPITGNFTKTATVSRLTRLSMQAAVDTAISKRTI